MSDNSDLYKGLKALTFSDFPKKCPSCGAIYENEEDFIAKTKELGNSTGLKQSKDDNSEEMVELFRNCICGSTLMNYFQNRRDQSERGKKRRETFDKVMKILQEKGVSEGHARQELLKVVYGGKSTLIESYGIKFKE
jgi:tRNA G37 N-methylase Trm5